MPTSSLTALRPRAAAAVAASGLSLITLLGVSPAQAASRTVSDPSGDAPRALDITSVRYTNNDSSVVFTWHLRTVANTTRLIGTTLDTCGGACSDYYQYRVGKASGVARVRVYAGTSGGGLRHRSCGGARVSWRPADHLVRAWIPKRCMVGPAALYMQSWSARTWSGRAVDVTRIRHVARG